MDLTKMTSEYRISYIVKREIREGEKNGKKRNHIKGESSYN